MVYLAAPKAARIALDQKMSKNNLKVIEHGNGNSLSLIATDQWTIGFVYSAANMAYMITQSNQRS
jgi:hypothetical protein